MPWPIAYIAVVEPAGSTKMELNDSERGWRLFVTGTTYQGRELFVVLFPVDEGDGLWRLGTAMPAS